MTENEKIIVKFYSAFANGDASTMSECYHPDIAFRDPVFGLLKGGTVSKMWKMLIESSKGALKIDVSDIKADEYVGAAQWTASYIFSKTNRKVINVIQARFHFQDGLIIKHTDDFDLWKWSKQAFGITGVLFGWTGHMQKKINEKAVSSLKKYK
ncbi:nuclear transport factor 2 family protein [Flavobacterium frigoris]|uniref:SnoaL-like domain-containing protein n=1 Tax=Flavobacterium frigoris (strain PS1) TaxID=1086011 RepID=H7FWD4_FLAFP|nr:nuclear transport factor 2 family protein [Flavobacterium frigoris]EIA07209.1 hypothetical protein HJ01_03481 [Flavobacterium frigoris PS1]